MATITTTGSGNWSSTTADAPWPSGTKPTTGDVVEIAAGHTVTLDEDTAVLGAAGIKNVTGSNTSVLAVSGTRTINGCVSCSGTATSGFITVGTGAALTINYGGGAGTKAVTNTGVGGYLIVLSGSGTLTVSNSGGIAISAESTGRAVYHNGTGAISVTGSVTCTNANGNVIRTNAAGAITITGDVIGAGGVTIGLFSGNPVSIVGNIYNTSVSQPALQAYNTGTVVTWIGERTLAANTDCYIELFAGTLKLASDAGAGALALANSGRFVIRKTGGTLTTTDGAYTASIVNQSSDAQATILGAAFAVTGPTLPAAGDVDSTATDYGYAASLVEPTCLLPAEGQVEETVGYGAGGTEFEGTLDVPTAEEIAAAMWSDITSPDRTTTA